MTSSTILPITTGKDELPPPKWTDTIYGTVTAVDCFDDADEYVHTQFEFVIREESNQEASVAAEECLSLDEMR